MANLLQKVIQRSTFPALSMEQYAQFFDFGGLSYPFTFGQTIQGHVEEANGSFEGLIYSAFKSNGIVFACMMARMMAFSEARFQYRQRINGRPGNLFGTNDLAVLERPWPGGVTADLLSRAIQDVDLAGNFFAVRRPTRIRRLRPDWVTIILGSMDDPDLEAGDIDAETVGYIYHPGGRGSGREPIFLLREEVAHFAPIPDPSASFRGMSWLLPIIREFTSDTAMTIHKQSFLEHGAPQPLDSRVLTSRGWSTMGAMRLGERVIGRDGQPHEVVGVYPQGERDVYRVTFTDGVSAESTLDHVWRVATEYDRDCGVSQDLTLAEIVEIGTHYPSGAARWSIPLVEPVEYASSAPLRIDPYLVGALLGDGSLRPNARGSGGVSFASGRRDADEWVHLLTPTLPRDVSISRNDRRDGSQFYFKGAGAPRTNALTALTKEIGIWGAPAHEKVIPDDYMLASVADRVSLLQGLIDTDGSVDLTYRSQVTFASTSEVLANQVAELARGLGGRASVARAGVRPKEPNRRPMWRVYISRLPVAVVPCRLSRKRSRYLPPSLARSSRTRYIASVDLVGRKLTQCIRLDGWESLYVTDDYVVTHNTPNMVVTLDASIKKEAFKEWVAMFADKHEGVANAYKTLYLGAGSSIMPVGKDFRQMDFAVTQAAGELRIAAAAGVPATMIGLSEALRGSSLNAGNYMSSMRRFADLTMRPLWRNMSTSLEMLVRIPAGAELWYDDRDIPFLFEDFKDRAEVQKSNVASIRQLIDGGFEPKSVVDAITSNDLTRLKHTGLLSVQLQPPGTKALGPGDSPAPAAPPADAKASSSLEVVPWRHPVDSQVILEVDGRSQAFELRDGVLHPIRLIGSSDQ